MAGVSEEDLPNWLFCVISEPKTGEFDPGRQLLLILPALINRDYGAVGAWISDLPESPFKRDGVRTYLELVSPHEPEMAAEFARLNQVEGESQQLGKGDLLKE